MFFDSKTDFSPVSSILEDAERNQELSRVWLSERLTN